MLARDTWKVAFTLSDHHTSMSDVLCWSMNGLYFISASDEDDDGRYLVRLWDVEHTTVLKYYKHDARAQAVQFRPNSNTFIMLDEDTKVQMAEDAVQSTFTPPHISPPHPPTYPNDAQNELEAGKTDDAHKDDDDSMVLDDDDDDDDKPVDRHRKLNRMKSSKGQPENVESVDVIKRNLGLDHPDAEDRDEETERKEALERKISLGKLVFIYIATYC